ncbi:MAG: hypothetical protein OXR71_11110, partial [Gemmatimonadota bacterium]|nr:hypothetical protein [Gemmatimonadota bacterium]
FLLFSLKKMHVAFLNAQHSTHSSKPKSLIPIINLIKIVPIVAIGKGQGRDSHRMRGTGSFKTIRCSISTNITFRVHRSIDQSQLASGRHVILPQYKNLNWRSLSVFNTAKSVPEIAPKQKKALECAQVLEKQRDKIQELFVLQIRHSGMSVNNRLHL